MAMVYRLRCRPASPLEVDPAVDVDDLASDARGVPTREEPDEAGDLFRFANRSRRMTDRIRSWISSGIASTIEVRVKPGATQLATSIRSATSWPAASDDR